MKGFGGRLLTFVFGMITGIIVFVLGLGGALYGIVTSVKVSQIEEKTGTDYTAGTPVADMSLLQLFNKLKETVADKDNITLASIEEVYGIDLVAKIESALEIQAENKTVLVKADELVLQYVYPVVVDMSVISRHRSFSVQFYEKIIIELTCYVNLPPQPAIIVLIVKILFEICRVSGYNMEKEIFE